MRKNCSRGIASVLVLTIGGCINAPNLSLNQPIASSPNGRLTRTIDHIACEVARAKKTNPKFTKYVVVAQLTLRVENSGGVTPSLSFIHPLTAANSSVTKSVGGEFTRGRTASFTQNFYLLVDELDADADCKVTDDPELLTGNLGIDEVVRAGINAIDATPGSGVKWATDKSAASAAPYFGTTVEFTTKIGVNAGPSVSKPKFRGGGGNNGLVNYSTLGKDTLVLAFAPVPPQTSEKSSPPKANPPKANQPARPDFYSQVIEIPGMIDRLPPDPNPAPTPTPTPTPTTSPEPPPPPVRTTESRKAAIAQAQRLLDSIILQNINPSP